MSKLLLSVLILLNSSKAIAKGCAEKSVVGYFANGMFNSRRVAEASREALEVKLFERGIYKSQIKIAYNLDEPALEQLLEVASQKSEDYGRSFWSYLANLSTAPKQFQELAIGVARSIDQRRYVKDGDLRRQVIQYQNDLKRGKSVFVVAHSQGNFYSNASWFLIDDDESMERNNISIISVATPANEVAGNGFYLTLTQDLIISAVQLFAGALPANATNSSASLSGHEFVTDYLSGDQSEETILSALSEVASPNDSTSLDMPSLSDSSYVHASLLRFWRYARQLENRKSPMSTAECLAVSSFAETYSWWGVACENRNLSAVKAWMNDCFEESWSDPNKFDHETCTLLGDYSGGALNLNTSSNFDSIMSAHPECIWKTQAVPSIVTKDVLVRAQEILNNPPEVR